VTDLEYIDFLLAAHVVTCTELVYNPFCKIRRAG
jgi:hypothetical protein